MPSRLSEEVAHEREREQLRHSQDRLLNRMVTDQEARDSAAAAMAQQQAHELLCAERWKNQNEAMIRMEASVRAMKEAMDKRIGQLPAGIISILMGLVGFLAARAFPLH